MSGTTIEVLSAEYKSLKLIRWTKKKSSSSSLPWMICALFIYYCMMKKVWHSVDFFFNLESKYIKLIVYWLDRERSMVQITEAPKVNEKKKSSSSSLSWMICVLFIYYCTMKKVWHSAEFFWNLKSRYIKPITYQLVIILREVLGSNHWSS